MAEIQDGFIEMILEETPSTLVRYGAWSICETEPQPGRDYPWSGKPGTAASVPSNFPACAHDQLVHVRSSVPSPIGGPCVVAAALPSASGRALPPVLAAAARPATRHPRRVGNPMTLERRPVAAAGTSSKRLDSVTNLGRRAFI